MKDNQIKKLLSKKPKAIELFLMGDDLFRNEQRTRRWIKRLQKMGITVMLYVARNKDNKYISLTQADARVDIETLEKAGKLCKDLQVRAIVHCALITDTVEGFLYKNMERIHKYLPYFYFENMPTGIFSDYKRIIEIGRKAGIRNVCIDTCHLYERYRDNGKVLDAVKALSEAFVSYFHLVDADGITHGKEIGTGNVHFDAVMPYVGEATVEIICKNYDNPVEMIRSYDRILKYKKAFNRIVMPLPHTADDFLDVALAAIRPGGVIHFYDVLQEKDIPAKSVAKIQKACKKAKRACTVIHWNKCGDLGVRTFRVCVDFRVD